MVDSVSQGTATFTSSTLAMHGYLPGASVFVSVSAFTADGMCVGFGGSTTTISQSMGGGSSGGGSTNAAPVLSGLSTETLGQSGGSSSVRLTGFLADMTNLGGSYSIEIDANGDSIADSQFMAFPGSLNQTFSVPSGSTSLSVRAVEQVPGARMSLSGSWNAVGITPPPPASVTLQLSSLNFVRRDEFGSISVSGQLSGVLTTTASAGAVYRLEIDGNSDGVAEQSFEVVSGTFGRAFSLSSGTMAFKVRVTESHSGIPTASGSWSQVTVPMNSVANTAPTLTNCDFTLVGNGQTPGTNLLVLEGLIGDLTAVPGELFTIEVNWTGGSLPDSTWNTSVGNFQHQLSVPGSATQLRVRVRDGNSAATSWVELSLEPEDAPPAPAGLELTEASVVAETVTMTGRSITISGVLTDDVNPTATHQIEVDLDGNGVADSVRTVALGSFSVDETISSSASSVRIRAVAKNVMSVLLSSTDWVTLTISGSQTTSNSAPVLQSLQFTPDANSAGPGHPGILSGTISDGSASSLYSLKIDYTGQGVDEAEYGISLGTLSQSITVPAGVTVFRVRVVETVLGTNDTWASTWIEVERVEDPPEDNDDPPGEDTPSVVVDWNAIEQARQHAIDAQVAYEQTIADIDALGQLAYDTFEQAQLQAEIDRESAMAAARADYETEMQVVEVEYQSEITAADQQRDATQTTIDSENAVSKAASAAEKADELASATEEYNQSKLAVEVAYNASQSAADAIYQVAVQAAINAYTAASNSIASRFSSAQATSSTLHATEIAAAATSYATAVSSATAQRSAALQSHLNARNANIAGLRSGLSAATSSFTSWNYDPSGTESDAGVQQAVAAAIQQFNLDMALANQAYDAAIDGAQGVFDSAMLAAEAAWDSAIAAAELARTTARNAATAAHEAAVASATGTYNVSLQAAGAQRDADKAQASADFDRDEGDARDARDDDLAIALGTYNQEIADALAILNGGLNSDQTLYGGRLTTLRDGWVSSVTIVAEQYNVEVADAQQDYADNTFWNEINIYLDPVELAYDALNSVVNGLLACFSDAAYLATYTDLVTKLELTNIAIMTGLATPQDLWQIRKDLCVWQAAQKLAEVSLKEPVALAYITDERAKATALADATAGETFSMLGRQLTATEALAGAMVGINTSYELGAAEIEKDQFQARIVKVTTYLLAAAKSAFDYEKTAISVGKTYSLVVAGLQETYDFACNAAQQTYELAKQSAEVVKEKALVDADVTRTKAEADADLQAVIACSAANTAYTQAAAAAYVAFVDSAATAELTYSIAYTTAVKSAATPIIMAQAAAICQQLGGTPDAFFYTQQNAMEQLAEVAEWASQIVDDTAAQGAFERAESLAYQTQMNDEAAADEKQANADAQAAKEALGDEADAWALAEKADIDGDAIKGTAEINAAKLANDQDAETERKRTEAEIAANAKQQRSDLGADYLSDTLEIGADAIQTYLTSEAEYNRLLAESPANIAAMMAQVTSDILKARAEAASSTAAVRTLAALDAQAAVSRAAKVLAKDVQDAADNLAYISLLPLSAFEYGEVPGLAFLSHWVGSGPDLDSSVNFMTGWIDGLSGGLWTATLGPTGYLSQVDQNTLAYTGGRITGTVHAVAMAFLSGGACSVGWAGTVSNGLSLISSGYAMYEAAPRILNGSASVWDYLAFLPAAGYMSGRLISACFVAETEIATGWGTVEYASAAMPLASDPLDPDAPALNDWRLECVLLGVSILAFTAVYARKRQDRKNELDHYFATERGQGLDEDPHVSLPPPDLAEAPDHSPHVGWALLPVEQAANAMRQAELSIPLSDSDAVETFGTWELEAQEHSLILNQTPEPQPRQASSGPRRRVRHRAAESWRTPGWMAAVAVLLAFSCFWYAAPSSGRPGATPVLAAATSTNRQVDATGLTPARGRQLLTKRIDQIRPGMRVLADNPELHGVDISERRFDPETTRLVTLHQIKSDGHELTVESLMPVDVLAAAAIEIWIDSPHQIEHHPWVGNAVDVVLSETLVGTTLELNLPELGAEGPAEVINIAACPPIESSSEPGRRLVTSVFRHTANNIVDLEIQGRDSSIGTTANHPFWSVDRDAFVPAGELQVGERLKQADGLHTQVTRITPRRGPPTTVYNLEVDGQHVYHVGQDGVLVHNDCVYVQSFRDVFGRVRVTYVGITNNIMRRASEHARNGRFVNRIPGFTNLSRYDCLSVEQVLIEHFRKTTPGSLANIRNAISPHNRRYSDAILNGQDLLRKIGFPGF